MKKKKISEYTDMWWHMKGFLKDMEWSEMKWIDMDMMDMNCRPLAVVLPTTPIQRMWHWLLYIVL